MIGAKKFINFLGLKNIAVLTPYPKDVNVTVYEYLSDNNINIESFSSFNLIQSFMINDCANL